jgi:hypothetical protein
LKRDKPHLTVVIRDVSPIVAPHLSGNPFWQRIFQDNILLDYPDVSATAFVRLLRRIGSVIPVKSGIHFRGRSKRLDEARCGREDVAEAAPQLAGAA